MTINWPTGDKLIDQFKEKYGDKTILAFSRGKDSIAAALALRGKVDVIPVHYDNPPYLDFITESLAYYVRQVEKFAARYRALGSEVSWNAEEQEMAGEFLAHAAALKAEREAAAAEGREPRLAALLDSWGGATIAYRRISC